MLARHWGGIVLRCSINKTSLFPQSLQSCDYPLSSIWMGVLGSVLKALIIGFTRIESLIFRWVRHTSEWMTAICLASCSIVYWSLGRHLEIDHKSAIKMLLKETLCHYDISLRKLEAATADRTCCWTLRYEASTVFEVRWFPKFDRLHNITATVTAVIDFQFSHCARLWTFRLGLQSQCSQMSCTMSSFNLKDSHSN